MASDHEGLDESGEPVEPAPLARRNLLRIGGIAAAGAAAAAVATVANASPAGADPVYLQLGVENNAGPDFTVLKAAQASGIPTLFVGSESGNGGGTGLFVYGTGTGLIALTGGYGAAVEATDKHAYGPGTGLGPAVKAHLENNANNSPAVEATTNAWGEAINASIDNALSPSDAVLGSTAGTGSAVVGSIDNPANDSPSVVGQTVGSGAAVEGRAHGGGTGVFGRAGFSSGHTLTGGVVGDSAAEIGVAGLSTSNTGVHARTESGVAIDAATSGTTNANPAVLATAAGPGPAVRAVGKVVQSSPGIGSGNGAALDVQGRSTFSRSGVVTIAAGLSSALTTLVPGGLSSASHVLATLQTNAGPVCVRAAVPILGGADKGKIRIHLTAKAPAGGVKVAWLVFG